MDCSVTIKILIDKSEYDRLNSIAKAHSECAKSSLTKEGSGVCNPVCKDSIEESECTQNPERTISKQTITQTEEPKSAKSPVSNQIVADYIRKRFKRRALTVLHKLEAFKKELFWNEEEILPLTEFANCFIRLSSIRKALIASHA